MKSKDQIISQSSENYALKTEELITSRDLNEFLIKELKHIKAENEDLKVELLKVSEVSSVEFEKEIFGLKDKISFIVR